MAPALAPTPLLNRESPLPRPKKRGRGIQQLISAAIAAAIVFWGNGGSFDTFDLTTAAVAFLVTMCLGVLIHELGHLAAGKLAGFEFYQILAGPWMLSRESAGLKLRFLPKRMLAPSGLTVMFPRTTTNLRRDFAIFVAGGPVATALCFVALLVVPPGSVWWGILLANVSLAAASWIPMTIAGQTTDGRYLLVLAQGGPSAEVFAALSYVMAIENQGTAPRDWPREIIDRLSIDMPGGAYNWQAATMVYIHRADVGESAAMADGLEKVLAQSGRMSVAARRMYMAEAAYFVGVHRKDAALAEAWLADARKVKGGVTLKDWDAAASAAVCYARGNHDEARGLINRAIERLNQMSLVRGSVLAARRRLEALRESLPAAQMAQPSLSRFDAGQAAQ